MEWEASPEWAEIMGDQGPWIRHVAMAWQAAASKAPDRPVPTRPDRDAEHDVVIAYWAPLLPLLVFGLGWTRPDLGLARWRDQGWPTDEPILAVVERWWGREGVADILAWSAALGGLSFRLESGMEVWGNSGDRRFEDTDEYARRREDPDWQRVWGGGGDSMHLTHHFGSPLELTDNNDPRVFDARDVDPKDVAALPRFHITTDQYAGWYANFFHYRPGLGPNGRSIRTEVVVTPVGWMGEFRWHKKTGIWFRGRSSVHLWGQAA